MSRSTYGTEIKSKFAGVLERLLAESEQTDAQVASRLGMSRQRLHQLKSGEKSASISAIVDTIECLGYRVSIEVHTEKVS